MYGTMRQMMGGNYPTSNPMPTYVWYSIAVLITALAVGVVGLLYYAAYPEIRQSPLTNSHQTVNTETQSPNIRNPIVSQPNTIAGTKEDAPTDNKQQQSWSMLLHTSKPEERKVLELLSSHNGTYLQKLIVRESGLSKLKTHRIISRFAERGIVNVSKSGNTNEVRLASWISNQSSKSGA